MNSAYADKLGKELSFEKGIKGWEIKLEGLVNDLSWNIYSYSTEKWEPYGAGGNVLKINAKNGKYKITDWSEIE